MNNIQLQSERINSDCVSSSYEVIIELALTHLSLIMYFLRKQKLLHNTPSSPCRVFTIGFKMAK